MSNSLITSRNYNESKMWLSVLKFVLWRCRAFKVRNKQLMFFNKIPDHFSLSDTFLCRLIYESVDLMHLHKEAVIEGWSS